MIMFIFIFYFCFTFGYSLVPMSIANICVNFQWLILLTNQIMLFRWLHALSKTGGSTVNIRRKISISHRNKTVNTISDDILEHGHLQIWHENSIEVAQFLHERLGIQDLRDLRYAMHTDIEGALAGAVSERFIFLIFSEYILYSTVWG